MNARHHQFQQLDEQGIRDACISSPSAFCFSFFYYFTNNFLQLDSVYVNCEGNDEHTTTNANTWRNSGGLELRLRHESQVIILFCALVTIFYNQVWTAMGRRQTHITVIPTPWRTEALDADALWARGQFFFFSFFFVTLLTIFLQLDNMYVDCDRPTTKTHSPLIPTFWRTGDSRHICVSSPR